MGIRKGSYSIYRDETLNLASGKTPNKPQSSPMPEAKYSLQDYDIIVIEGGANDYSRGVSLGSFGNMDTSTFYGAYSTMMQTIRKASQKRIADGKKPIKVVCTGMFFSDKNYTDPVHPVSKYKRKNSKGFTYQDYENAIVKEHKTVFLEEIGGVLKSGQKHDDRAPDYDDWALNGDLFLWNDVIGCAEEISSMGIRVNAKSLTEQLKICDAEDRLQYPYHRGIDDGTLPLTIGGGIGQSRVCMYMLKKAHIGEVQVSVWPDDMVIECAEHGITLLT